MLPVNIHEQPEGHTAWDKSFPYVEIIEQPALHSLRFRYECERRSAGSLLGEHSTVDKKTFPTIQIHGYKGPAAIVVSCVTKEDPPRPHPHGITGRHSNQQGIYSTKVNIVEGIVSFNHLGIQCIKKKQIKGALEIRKLENVDPFRTGFDHMHQPDKIDLNCVRLCFQVFIQGAQKKFNVPLKPVLTTLVYDKKTIDDLMISKLSTCSAPASGGVEMILLCGKINKEDVQVRFFEMRSGWLYWEDFGQFRPIDVHKQVAIVFRTPAYCHQNINEPATVQIQLRKKSDGSVSKSLPFLMLPPEIGDTNSLKRKRMKFNNDPKSYLLRQMQAEKQNTMLNQTLFNMPNARPENIPARPQQNFQTPFYHNNYIPPLKKDLNIHCNGANQQLDPLGPIPPPRNSIQNGSAQANNEAQIALQARDSTKAKLPIVKKYLPPSQTPRTEIPQPQPRRSLQAPPNMTMNSYDYREATFPDHLQESLGRYPKFSSPRPQNMQMNDDPFELNNLPSNFQPLSPEDLATFEAPPARENHERLSNNLSERLDISDEIEDAFQNIQDLTEHDEQNQQQVQRKIPSYKTEASFQNVTTFNNNTKPDYENQPDQINFFS